MATQKSCNPFSFLVAALIAAACQGHAEAPGAVPVPSGQAELAARIPAKPSKKARKDRPDQRAAWNKYWFGQTDPDYLKHKARVAAEEAEKWNHLLPQNPELPFAPGTLNTWINLGPHANVTTTARPDVDSGRVTAIVPDPNNIQTLYVATSGGGVFRCTNANLDATGDWIWTPITDHLPSSSSSGNVSVGALTMPVHYLTSAQPNILYLGAGDPFDAEATGFFRSADGGASWTAATGLGNQTRTYDILADIQDPNINTLLVGTNDGLKRSTDGGATFSPVSLGGSTTGKIWTIKRCTQTNLICSRQTDSGLGSIWYSQDNGATWAQAVVAWFGAPPGRISLATSPYDNTAAGIFEIGGKMASGILRTTDGGHTWIFVAAPTAPGGLFQPVNGEPGDGEQGEYNQLIIMDRYAVNGNRIFVGANGALYRTLDGGANWEQLTSWNANGRVYAHADFHTAAWAKFGAFGLLLPLYIGTDGGLSILRNPLIPSASIPTGPGMVPSNPAFLDNRRNRGLASHLVYNVGSTDAISPVDAQTRITLGLQDNGTRVRVGSAGTFEDRLSGDGFGTLIHPTNGDLMLGSHEFAEILKSVDGGTSFQSTSGIPEAGNETSAPAQTRLVQGTPSDTVYTHTNKKLYRSLSFGSLWTPVSTTGIPASRTIRNLAAATSNPNALAVVTTGATGYATTDGGANWAPFGTFPNFGTWEGTSCVWFDSANASVLYAASVAPSPTASHIWRSANGGISWTAIDRTNAGGSNGFPFGIPVHVIKNDPADSRVVFAGTDIGVYRSDNAGVTWSRYGQGLPMVAVLDLFVSASRNFVRAATFGRGVWELREHLVLPPAPPAFTSQPLNQTVTAGQSATFSALASGNPTPSYQWQRYRTFWYAFGSKSYWVDIPGAAFASYTTAPTVAADNGAKFRVLARNGTGILATSNTAVLTVR